MKLRYLSTRVATGTLGAKCGLLYMRSSSLYLHRGAEGDDVLQDILVVAPEWLEQCVLQQRRVDPKEREPPLEAEDPRAGGRSPRRPQGRYKYLLSVLSNDRVSTTGFTQGEIHSLCRKIAMLGGLFDPELQTTKCTVLIAKHAAGHKFEAARRNSIPIVSEDWLAECIRQGARATTQDFCVAASASAGHQSHLSQNSNGAGRSMVGSALQLSEIIVEDSMDVSAQPHSLSAQPLSLSRISQSQHSQETQQLSLKGSESGREGASDSYLEDLKIFLASDIDARDRAELLKICRAAMATIISADPSGKYKTPNPAR